MAETTWKQVVYDAADAYREASKTTDKIPVGQLANLIRQGAGGEDVTAEVTEYETLLETAIANLAGKAFKPTQSKTVTPTAAGLTVTPDEGQSLGEVIINGDADLIAENIRQGIDIFGVLGTMSEGVSGIDYGEVTFTSAPLTFSISHALDKTPTRFVLVPIANAIDTYHAFMFYATSSSFNGSACGVYVPYTRSLSAADSTSLITTSNISSKVQFTADSVTVTNDTRFSKGSYIWIVM